MSILNCNCRCACGLRAVAVSAIVGVLAAFFLITGVITVLPVFLWVAFGVSAAYLGVLTLALALTRRNEGCSCQCDLLKLVLAGILGTILLSLVLLAVGIVATSILSAILVGILLFAFALIFTATACFVVCLTDCEGCNG